MKRYDPVLEQLGEPVAEMELCDGGEYVKAEVAQALYDELMDAVAWYRSEMEECEDDDNEYVASQWRERMNDAAKALSLADGEE